MIYALQQLTLAKYGRLSHSEMTLLIDAARALAGSNSLYAGSAENRLLAASVVSSYRSALAYMVTWGNEDDSEWARTALNATFGGEGSCDSAAVDSVANTQDEEVVRANGKEPPGPYRYPFWGDYFREEGIKSGLPGSFVIGYMICVYPEQEYFRMGTCWQ